MAENTEKRPVGRPKKTADGCVKTAISLPRHQLEWIDSQGSRSDVMQRLIAAEISRQTRAQARLSR